MYIVFNFTALQREGIAAECLPILHLLEIDIVATHQRLTECVTCQRINDRLPRSPFLDGL